MMLQAQGVETKVFLKALFVNLSCAMRAFTKRLFSRDDDPPSATTSTPTQRMDCAERAYEDDNYDDDINEKEERNASQMTALKLEPVTVERSDAGTHWTFALVSTGKDAYLFGGSFRDQYTNRLWRLSFSGATLSMTQLPPPPAEVTERCGVGGWYDQGCLHFYGGFRPGDSRKDFKNDVVSYDIQSGNWNVTTLPLPSRNGAATVFVDGKVWVFSGNGGIARASTMSCFDLYTLKHQSFESTATWEQKTPRGRAYHASFHWEGRIGILGGISISPSNHLWFWHIAEERWYRYELGDVELCYASVQLVGDVLYVVFNAPPLSFFQINLREAHDLPESSCLKVQVNPLEPQLDVNYFGTFIAGSRLYILFGEYEDQIPHLTTFTGVWSLQLGVKSLVDCCVTVIRKHQSRFPSQNLRQVLPQELYMLCDATPTSQTTRRRKSGGN